MAQQKKSILPWLIVGGLGLFVLFMLQFLIRGMNHDLNLVGDDYYDKAQQYDSQMAVTQNTMAEGEGMQILFNENKGIVEIEVPENIKGYEGTLKFYRPSDAKMDFNLSIKEGQQKFDVSHAGKGLWQLQLTLKAGEKSYFKEKQIIIK